MVCLIFSAWLLGLARLACALDPVGANNRYLINNRTKGTITLNGMYYSLTNSTTNIAELDPVTDAEACTRDAALMSRLGINNIYVDSIDPTANHDDCFSIFNSVGIYVTVILSGNASLLTEGVDGIYTTERLMELFRRVDAIKDYDNLLGIDVGLLPLFQNIEDGRFADLQNIFRAFIRDIKEYVHYNSPRPLLVGASIARWIRSEENVTMTPLFDHMSCVIPDEQTPSSADFVGFYELEYFAEQTPSERMKNFTALATQIDNSTVPTWFSAYGTAVGERDGVLTMQITNETLQETDMLYNLNSSLLVPFGPLSGGNRVQWTNVHYSDPANWGITRTDEDGNMQLTESFDILLAIFASYNTELWLSGDMVGTSDQRESIECKPELILNQNYTTTWNSPSTKFTLTLATEWELPTRPPALDAVITSGMQGTRGQMVDVVVTTIKHQIRDSKGDLLTDVVLSPSKSEKRTTTAKETSQGTSPPTSTPSTGLSTGAKAGIGAGVGIGGAIALLGAGLYLLRKRKSKSVAAKDTTRTNDDSDGLASVNQFDKAELATGPDVEAQPPAELPDKWMATPNEVPGNAFPGIGTTPVELPDRWMTTPKEVPGNAYPGIGTTPVELSTHEPALETVDAKSWKDGTR